MGATFQFAFFGNAVALSFLGVLCLVLIPELVLGKI